MLLKFDEIIKKHNIKIKNVIHVGAHYGQEHNLYESSGASHVIYFEPHPEVFKVLSKKFIRNKNTTLVNKALGSQKGILQMYCSKNNRGMSNSLLKPQDHEQIYPSIVFNHKVEVKVSTLDREMRIFTREKRKEFNCLVMDVQGFELEVLKGSINTLSNIDCIFTEINFRYMYENCAQSEDLDFFLSKLGFSRVETFDTEMGWGDALYLKGIE